MEIIAMGELRAYLKEQLPNYEDPVIYISSEYFPGCSKCNSSATTYYISLTERELIPIDINIERAKNHKFPIDIYVSHPTQKRMPEQIVIGTKKSKGALQMVLRRVID